NSGLYHPLLYPGMNLGGGIFPSALTGSGSSGLPSIPFPFPSLLGSGSGTFQDQDSLSRRLPFYFPIHNFPPPIRDTPYHYPDSFFKNSLKETVANATHLRYPFSHPATPPGAVA
ncbi:unnamed protein product, partial [Lymnaea stagnalis]